MKPPPEVEIFHRINRLKSKAAGGQKISVAPGYIDATAIAEAQNVLEFGKECYQEQLEIIIANLGASWSALKKEASDGSPGGNSAVHLERIYNYANNIKDLAETYNFLLMLHFGRSLRDFCAGMNAARKEHRIIVQAHVDAISVAFHENIGAEEDPKAIELKAMVARAIEKHS